jgi:signal transduction histidine kinase
MFRNNSELQQRQFPSAWLQMPKDLKTFRAAALVAVAYYLGAQAAFAVGTLSDRIFAPFWPPNIVLFCALVLAPRRHWWLYIAATFPAHALAEIGVGMPPAQLLVAFGTNCMVAILNAYGVRRFLKEPPWFGTLANASVYLLITAGVGPAISALGGAFVQIVGGGQISSYWEYWGNWYLANALASVTLGPVVLIWWDRGSWASRLSRARRVEACLLALGLGIVCAIVFHARGGTVESGFLPALLYSPIPLILWAAIRFGQRGASGAILVVTVVSIWQNLHESAVFAGSDPGRNVLALQIFLLGIAVPVFFLGALIDELGRTGEAMRQLAGTLLRVQDDERRRIARELHDSTGQNLVVAGMLLNRVQSMAPPSCEATIAELNEVLRQSMVEVRTLSYLLHPPLLDGMGLDMALRAYLDGFSQRTGIKVELDVPSDTERLSPSVERILFRVIQEALTNVWRHSGSATARVRLVETESSSGQHLTLSIEDFGKGIPDNILVSTLSTTKHDPPLGLGLVGMRERLHQIGGSLEIESTTGKTVIRAIVKVSPTDILNSNGSLSS